MAQRSRKVGLSAAGAATALVAVLSGSVVPSDDTPEAERANRDRARPQSKLVPQRQWEYMQLPCVRTGAVTSPRRELEERLNEHGKHGWELVSLFEVQQPPGRDCLIATFKRQVLN